MNICDSKKCTACCGCLNICPKGAISMTPDELGRTVAFIDKEKCINCGLCKKVCPVNSEIKGNYPHECYAAWSNNEKFQKSCASGGISTGFAEAVLENLGVVYGTVFDGTDLVFDKAESLADVEKFKGSKYVQANAGLIYKDVKASLNDSKEVMFCGTPCQVAGLKSYLGKEHNNLLTVDLICHGTPPITYLKEHIKSIMDSNVSNVTFRGEKDFSLTLFKNEKVIYSKKSQLDAYFTAFLEGIIFRENCYDCPYAKEERVSDITIGDFWELNKKEMKNQHNGRISVVLINTPNGQAFWDKVKDKFTFEERPVEEAIAGNGQLRRPSKRHDDRNKFCADYKLKGFTKAVKTKSVTEIMKRYKRTQNVLKVKRLIKKLISRG